MDSSTKEVTPTPRSYYGNPDSRQTTETSKLYSRGGTDVLFTPKPAEQPVNSDSRFRQEFIPNSKKGVVGLRNLGNTCFM